MLYVDVVLWAVLKLHDSNLSGLILLCILIFYRMPFVLALVRMKTRVHSGRKGIFMAKEEISLVFTCSRVMWSLGVILGCTW